MFDVIEKITKSIVALLTAGILAAGSLLGQTEKEAISPTIQVPIIAMENVQEASLSGQQAIEAGYASPTPIATPTPMISSCELEIQAMLPAAKEAYDGLIKIKAARLEVEGCTNESEKEACQSLLESRIALEDKTITGKLEEFKSSLKTCGNQNAIIDQYFNTIVKK
jgi:hypothetical protein